MAPIANSLNVVALVSGGKDSIFSMLHCLANGHKVVALGNLYPSSTPEIQNRPFFDMADEAETWDRDSNSFMYQTAGHNLVPLYSRALDLPLYREKILGSAHDGSKTYGANAIYPNHQQFPSNITRPATVDEVESLRSLLGRIISAHPEINAVSSGAILSTYQRTRVESVAISLDLIPLSFLWQYPILPPATSNSLLNDMRNVELDVRIVKVASGGLSDTLLWENLLDPSVAQKVERAMARFGGSVLGEGGEYETMVLDGPRTVWRNKIVVADSDMQRLKENDGTAWLVFRNNCGRLVPHEITRTDEVNSSVRKPAVWDKTFETLLANFETQSLHGPEHLATQINPPDDQKKGTTTGSSLAVVSSGSIERGLSELSKAKTVHIERRGLISSILNIAAFPSVKNAAQQMVEINQQLADILSRLRCPISSVIFSTLLISSMSDFAAVNAVYAKLFSKPNPPARVTIACPLPLDIQVMLSINLSHASKIEALHVQSRSYWAPANIGPYSQAAGAAAHEFGEDQLVYFAGQIPLLPATMQLLQSGPSDNEETADQTPGTRLFIRRSLLSLQHLWRVGYEMKISCWTGVIAFITREGEFQEKARTAWEIWQNVHNPDLWEHPDDDSSSFDIWDKTYGAQNSLVNESQSHRLPDFLNIKYRRGSFGESYPVPGFFCVQVIALPRESDIEWQATGIACDECEFEEDTFEGNRITTCYTPRSGRHISFVEIAQQPASRHPLRGTILKLIDWAQENSLVDCQPHCTVYAPQVFDLDAQMVPCYNIWGRHGQMLDAGVVIDYIGQ